MLKKIMKECKTKGDRTNQMSALKELNRISGLYGDGEGPDENIEQKELSLDERKAVLLEELDLIEKIEKVPHCIAE